MGRSWANWSSLVGEESRTAIKWVVKFRQEESEWRRARLCPKEEQYRPKSSVKCVSAAGCECTMILASETESLQNGDQFE